MTPSLRLINKNIFLLIFWNLWRNMSVKMLFLCLRVKWSMLNICMWICCLICIWRGLGKYFLSKIVVTFEYEVKKILSQINRKTTNKREECFCRDSFLFYQLTKSMQEYLIGRIHYFVEVGDMLFLKLWILLLLLLMTLRRKVGICLRWLRIEKRWQCILLILLFLGGFKR